MRADSFINPGVATAKGARGWCLFSLPLGVRQIDCYIGDPASNVLKSILIAYLGVAALMFKEFKFLALLQLHQHRSVGTWFFPYLTSRYFDGHRPFDLHHLQF